MEAFVSVATSELVSIRRQKLLYVFYVILIKKDLKTSTQKFKNLVNDYEVFSSSTIIFVIGDKGRYSVSDAI